MPPPVTIVPGRTFFPPGREATGHLQIVLSRPVDGFVFVVNLTDAAKCQDKSVIVNRWEHRALTKQSAAWFSQYKLWPEATVQLLLNGLERRDDVSAELFSKLIDGCQRCWDIPPPRIEKYLGVPSLATQPGPVKPLPAPASSTIKPILPPEAAAAGIAAK